MKLHSDTTFGLNSVTGYGPGYVAVNGRRHETSLVLGPRTLETDFPATSFDAITAEALAPLAGRPCDVLLIGTGNRQKFPPASVLRPIFEAGVGVEVMDTGAACRTYNVLNAEGRNPLALLIVEK